MLDNEILSEKIWLVEALKDTGLTELESKVYIFLAKNGTHKAIDISRKMNLHKAQVYHIIKNLQNYGIIEVSMESPMRFTAIPFEKVLDLLIKTKKGEVRFLEDKRNDSISLWSSIKSKNYEYDSEKFTIIQGEYILFSKFLQMIENADTEILAILTKINGPRSNPSVISIKDAINKDIIKIRLLTCITEENFKIMRFLNKEILSVHHKSNIHHVNIDPNLIHFLIIIDNKEIFFGITPKNKNHREKAGFWTNCKPLIYVLKNFFGQLWNNSIDIERKLLDIETNISQREIQSV